MRSIEKRLQDLEAPINGKTQSLPFIVDDDTPDHELARLRRDGRVVMRFSEFLEIAI